MEKEMNERFLKCEDIIQNIRGTFITPQLAEQMNELQKGGFRVSETRLDDNHSLVVMERQVDKGTFDKPYFFIVECPLNGKLHFN